MYIPNVNFDVFLKINVAAEILQRKLIVNAAKISQSCSPMKTKV